MAEEMGVPFLGSIPIEPEIAEKADSGNPIVETDSVKDFDSIVEKILNEDSRAANDGQVEEKDAKGPEKHEVGIKHED